ncbi:MAG: hypothetical protein TREMPRED_001561 [Tremellales sp. Tagirdzhanova-0007]|nr:MAG: hypothetical protein TREMPRED_001561 [Tremellales sp. Tagirdzhanova-0007]
MAESSCIRSGLGFPSAVVIKSAPLPPRTTRLLAEDAQASLDSPSRYKDYMTWKEWTINPAKHGPERMRRPPVFIPSQQVYDELGRSMIDVVEVDVEEGSTKKEIEDGGRVAEWYLALSTNSTPGSGPSRAPVPLAVETTMQGEGMKSRLFHHTAMPRRAYRQDWFTRQSHYSPRDQPQHQHALSEPSSISSLLHIAPAQNRAPTAHYVLGPENKGYTLLRDRLGWKGGGLGRPEGWTSQGGDTLIQKDQRLSDEKEKLGIDKNGNLVIDFTADSDDDPHSVIDLNDDAVSPGGPGRTAPIATVLKLDRLGVGHLRAGATGATDDTKKVTHSASEIREAQRRARRRVVNSVALGKKGKVRWKERDKRDRDDRRRLAAALNA